MARNPFLGHKNPYLSGSYLPPRQSLTGPALEEAESLASLAPEPSGGLDYGNVGRSLLDTGKFLYESAIEAPTRAANALTQATLGLDYGDAARALDIPRQAGEAVARAITPDFIERRFEENLKRGREEYPRLTAVADTVEGFAKGLQDDPTTILPFVGGPKVAAFFAPHMLKGAGEAVADAAVEGIAGEGVTSPEFVKKGLNAGLQTGFAGLVGAEAAGLRHGRTGVAPGAVPEAPRVDLRSADPALNPQLAELRARFEADKMAAEAKRPPTGSPDLMESSALDEALSSADDELRWQRVRQEMASDMEAFQNAQTVANLRNFKQTQGLGPALTEATSTPEGPLVPRLGARLPELGALEGGDMVRMSPRAARLAEEMGVSAPPSLPEAPSPKRRPVVAAAPEPVQVGAIAEEPGRAVQLTPESEISNLTPEAAAPEPTFNPDVTQPVPFNPDTTQPIPKVAIPEPGTVKPATIFQPETKVPEGAISEHSAGLIDKQAELLKQAGLEDFPLVPDEARKMIFDGDAALSRLKQRGQAVAHDLGSAVGEGAGAIKDVAIYGASLIERGVRDFGAWSKEIVSSLGESVRPHLERAWETAQALWERAKAANSEVGAVGDITELVAAEKERRSTGRLQTAVGEAISRGELVELKEASPASRWQMGPYSGPTPREVFLSATGGKFKTAAEIRSEKIAGESAVARSRSIADLAKDADTMGLKLTKAEFNGLMRQTPSVVESVRAKVEAARRVTSEQGAVSLGGPRKIKPIPEKPATLESQIPETKPAEIDFDTARQFSDEDFAKKVESGKLSEGETKALESRLVERMVAREDAVKALNEARANNGDVGKANADLLQKSLDYVTSFGLWTKDAAAARRAQAAAAKLKQVGPQTPDAFLKKVFKEIPGVSNKQAAVLLDVFEKRPDALPDALRAAVKPGAFRKFLEFYKAMMLTGPPSHLGNIASNVMEQGMRAAETAIAASLDLAKPAAKRERFIGELGAEMAGAAKGFVPAIKSALGELRAAATLKPERFEVGAGKLEHSVGAIGGKTGRAVRTSFRLLEAADQFFKTMFGEADLYKLSYRKAARELGGKGDIKSRAAEIVNEARGDSGRHMELIEQVGQLQRERTFQQDPGQIGQSVNRLVNSFPALEMVVPFRKAPGNIIRSTIGRSPVGFVEAFKKAYDYRKGIGTRGEVLDAFAKPLLGTAVMAGFANLAMQGRMTGGGPKDKDLEALLRSRPGWQPYSFVFEVDGKKHYVPYSRFQPVSNLLGMAADMAEAKSEKEKQNLFERAIGTFKDNILDDSYLKSLKDAIDAAQDSNKIPAQLASMAGGLVPAIVNRAAQAADPVMRDTMPESKGLASTPERIVNTIKSRIPGLSETLPARKTATGEEVQRPGSAFSRFALPTQVSEEKPGSDLERTLVDLGVSRSAPGREVTIPHSKGQKIRLSDDEYEVLSAADKKATEALRRTLRSSAFRRLDQDEQKKHVESVYERYRSDAKKKLWAGRDLRRRASQQVRESRG